MVKKTKRARKPSRTSFRQQGTKRRIGPASLKTLRTLVVTVVGLIGLAASALAFYPFVSVTPIASTSSTLPFDTRFEIRNESPLRITRVHYSAQYIEGSPRRQVQQRIMFVSLDMTEVSVLDGHSSFSAYLDFTNGPPYIPEAPIAQIWVDFRPIGKMLPKMKRGFRFFARPNAEGVYQWLPYGRARDLLMKDRPVLIR